MEIVLQEKKTSSFIEAALLPRRRLRNTFHFERSRLNQLFSEAVRHPLVLVCAGAGYGKTSAVYDFVTEHQIPTAWMQISERDNVAERFWENYAHAWSQIDAAFANAIGKIGFPGTDEKQSQYQALAHKFLSPLERRIFVVDDVHLLENPAILRLSERIVNNLVTGTTTIWISRCTPRGNMADMLSKGQIFNVSESDLCFTNNELANYFRRLGILPQPECLREVMQDTEGWAFAINLIARSYQKAPGYGGYLRNAMKTNIFRVMETEIWCELSERVQCFLVRLSLIDHLSFDLIELLTGGDLDLIAELERQNAYMRRDSFINAYLIHPLFLEFLSTKQVFLSDEQKRETYEISGQWCNINGFNIDALSYYEKIGDYGKIIALLYAMPAQMPYDIAKYCLGIFERAPEEAYDKVLYLALTHVRCSMRVGLWKKATELAEYYEARFLALPEESPFRNANLGGLYLLMSYLRNFLCLSDEVFDFDIYLEKFCQCKGIPDALRTHSTRVRVLGPWVNANGSSRKGAPEEYIKAVSRAAAYMPKIFAGFMSGEEELLRGELAFFQGELSVAEAFIAQALVKAREHRQFEIQHRALLYSIRLGIAQGNYLKAEDAIKEMKSQLNETEYTNRYVNYDIALALYYYAIGLQDKMPDSIKQNILPYSHPSFIENLENQLKIRYCYMSRNYPPALAYIREMKQRESYLFGRVAMLAMEACIHYKMKDKTKAFETLIEAYETASPNGIIMPFIELAKDMRTLSSSALKEAGMAIPRAWLEMINRKSASFAKRQAHAVAEYRQTNRLDGSIVLSPRETEILRDLSHGLSRAEIAASRSLSINTVKMVINNIYSKLGAENVADLIRIAVERKMI
ncbi:MAG: LuxR C-terminal-related transcriptional regulator [Treponema sp.]|nr:LuxR C-terminal-related transcriptional regulator [Treponema sp.]